LLIGAGTGLSAAAGLEYAGEDFQREFQLGFSATVLQIYTPRLFTPSPPRKSFGHTGRTIFGLRAFVPTR